MPLNKETKPNLIVWIYNEAIIDQIKLVPFTNFSGFLLMNINLRFQASQQHIFSSRC